MLSREVLAIPIPRDDRIDINSGVARMSGVVWAALWVDDARPTDTAVLVVHPASNFLGHYALRSLAERGVAAVGLTTRYLGNDSALLMENCVLDVGAAITALHERGYTRVCLVGNSGGGGLAAMYQSQAEQPDIMATPAGDPPDLTRADLPAADSLVMAMAHPGRATVYTEGLDAAITDEARPFDRDPDLDLFAPGRTVPLDPDFVTAYRAGQLARNRRITAWVRDQLAALADGSHPACVPGQVVEDLPFLVHGTAADPRFVDLTLDPSDREAGTLWGPPVTANVRPASLGHHTSLRSWLSQWSVDDSRANAYTALPRVTVPVQVVYGSADCAAFPSHAEQMYAAIGHDEKALVRIDGADHYFQGRPDLAEVMVDHIVAWARR